MLSEGNQEGDNEKEGCIWLGVILRSQQRESDVSRKEGEERENKRTPEPGASLNNRNF